jgi:Xaa-Pro aminopeptidase
MEDLSERIRTDAAIKEKKVREYLRRKGLDGLLISTREQFAWVTGGGDSHVVFNSNLGFGTLVITRDKAYLVAHSMDAQRLFAEQVAGQDYELVVMRWYEGDVRQKALELAGKKVAADTDFPGTLNVYDDLVDLHYPMTDLEMERVRWLAAETDRLYTRFAETVKPGETEQEIAARFHAAHLAAGMQVDVLIVGSDERCFQYRHPIPTEKKLERYLMLHTAARRWGLHCNLTRFIHFGPPSTQIRKVYDAAAAVEARVFQLLEPGLPFADILKAQKAWYVEQGFPEEWRNHFQGGPTGYIIVDGGRCLTDKVVQVNQPYEWFITVTGTKMGELSLMTANGLEISSYLSSTWPGMTIQTEKSSISVPDLLVL